MRAAYIACAACTASVALVLHLRRRRRLSTVPLAFGTCSVHRLSSSAGLAYKLIVSLPLQYEPRSRSYPVVVVLDAEPYLFPLVTVCARTSHYFARSYYYPDVICVGIVADLEAEGRFWRGGRLDIRALWDGLRPTRARDYLPTAAESPWGAPGAEPLLHVSGHADEFVGFLVDTALPFVERRYATRGAAARALIGKSFGGSGVAHAMIDRRCAECFSEFILGSPSITWDDSAFFRLEAEARERARAAGDEGSPPFNAGVYCCLGSLEAREVTHEGTRYASACHRLQSVLDGRPGPRGDVVLDVVEGETHGSVSYPFVHRALAFLKERWQRFEQDGQQ
eukprot:Transcript_3187.p1 GENE.Transcript_3187~~Transcript_3187.p1  ORF type:complete len:361 (+),score=94.18 Transcript_3187:71-1084(+)